MHIKWRDHAGLLRRRALDILSGLPVILMHAKCSESLLYNSPKEESRELCVYCLL